MPIQNPSERFYLNPQVRIHLLLSCLHYFNFRAAFLGLWKRGRAMRMQSVHHLDLEKFPLSTLCKILPTCAARVDDQARNYLPGRTLKSINLCWQPDNLHEAYWRHSTSTQASLFTCLTNASPENLVTEFCHNRRRLSSSIWSLNYEMCHPCFTWSLSWLLGPFETTCFGKLSCCRLHAPMVPTCYSQPLLIPASSPDPHQTSQ